MKHALMRWAMRRFHRSNEYLARVCRELTGAEREAEINRKLREDEKVLRLVESYHRSTVK